MQVKSNCLLESRGGCKHDNCYIYHIKLYFFSQAKNNNYIIIVLNYIVQKHNIIKNGEIKVYILYISLQ